MLRESVLKPGEGRELWGGGREGRVAEEPGLFPSAIFPWAPGKEMRGEEDAAFHSLAFVCLRQKMEFQPLSTLRVSDPGTIF